MWRDTADKMATIALVGVFLMLLSWGVSYGRKEKAAGRLEFEFRENGADYCAWKEHIAFRETTGRLLATN